MVLPTISYELLKEADPKDTQRRIEAVFDILFQAVVDRKIDS